MSRSKNSRKGRKFPKGPGADYWSRRPYSGCSVDKRRKTTAPSTKTLTHRAERRETARIEHEAMKESSK